MADETYGNHYYGEHAAIRHDISQSEANIRDSIGATKYVVATEAAALSKQIGAEACAINNNIGETKYKVSEVGSDVRREVAETSADARREVAQGFGATGDLIMEEGQEGIMATKDARLDVTNRITNGTDRVSDRIMELRALVGERFYTVGRDLADLRQGQATLSKDIELNALKTQIEGQKNTQYLADKIVTDGEKTRGLINDLKYQDLNRALVERQAELVACETDRRHGWRKADQFQYGSQWAQLQNQVQAFQSQLQETRQGMVNFGSMNGNAGQQTSTSNNVR